MEYEKGLVIRKTHSSRYEWRQRSLSAVHEMCRDSVKEPPRRWGHPYKLLVHSYIRAGLALSQTGWECEWSRPRADCECVDRVGDGASWTWRSLLISFHSLFFVFNAYLPHYIRWQLNLGFVFFSHISYAYAMMRHQSVSESFNTVLQKRDTCAPGTIG